MKQKRTQHRLGDFMEGKGFYIVLFLCVAAIGISGYYLFNGLTGAVGGFGSDPTAAVSGQAEMEKDQTDVQTPTDQDQAAEDTVKTDDTAKEEEPAPQEEAAPDEEAAESTAYVWPVQGDVARDFSLEVFAYDTTMGDWRTHNGTDFSVAAGAPVLAVCDATVGAVWTDGLRGSCLRLDCGDKTYVTYCGLAANDAVTPGMTVKAGQEIGKVGNTMLTESMEESHLHIEVIKNGRYQDPEQFLK